MSWPSATNETYVVQYMGTLQATDMWLTLTDGLPAATSGNVTYFVHSNIVQYPPAGSGGGSSSNIYPEEMSRTSANSDAPMAIPPNGSGATVPLALYPPGFDLSGFLIYDPSTGESVSGNGYSVKSVSPMKSQGDGMQPLDASSDTNVATGFYRVVRDGVHIFGLTNGEVLSGTVQQPIEFAVDTTDEVIGVTFYDTNENPVIGAHAAPGPGGGWILNWNTTQSANGNYAIMAELDFA
ncbi:MAG: hypothetical protein ACREFR_10240, partial [Limisphaerales bacterium]